MNLLRWEEKERLFKNAVRNFIAPARFIHEGGPGTINVAQKPLDSDNDGMPDAFEDAWGLDKYDPTDAVKEAKNGYLNIENYALSLEYPDEYEYELNKNKQ